VDYFPDGGAVLEMLAGFLLCRHRHAGHYGLDDLVSGLVVQPISETLETLEEPAPELCSVNQVWLDRERTAGESCPAARCGVGRAATDAVLLGDIWRPCDCWTLTRTSCRARPLLGLLFAALHYWPPHG